MLVVDHHHTGAEGETDLAKPGVIEGEVKVGRTGGLTNAVAIHDLCRDHGISNWIGNMLESALGQAPALAMATLPNVKYPSDVFPSSRFYETDLSEPERLTDDLVADTHPSTKLCIWFSC